MPEIISLDKWLRSQTQTFVTRKRMLVLKDLIHVPTDEKVVEGFRYFDAPIESVLRAFDAGDLEGLAALPYALDEDGDPDTSAVNVSIAYTASGSYVAVQPQEYQDYVPVWMREPKVFTSSRARELAHALDQSA